MPTPKAKTIKHTKKKNIRINDGWIPKPDTSVINNKGISEINKLMDDDIVLDKGKIYFGIYTFLIKFALEDIDCKHILVTSL